MILLFIGIIFFRTKRERTRTGDCFGVLIVSTAVNLFFDMLSVYSVNHLDTVNPFVNRTFHNMFLGSIITCLFLHSLYIYYMIQADAGLDRRPPLFLYLPLLGGLAGITFAPLSYMKTSTVNYSYGSAANTCYICMGMYILMSLIYLVVYFKQIKRRKRIIITAALGIYIACSGYQALFPTSLISGLGLTLVVFAIFLTVESPDVHMNEVLQLEKKYILEADAAKSNFLAQMSHEFRTPINAILGMDEMILREYDEPQLNEYAITIHNASKTLLNQINNILDYSKLEFGMTELVEEEYDLCSLFGELVELVRARLQDKNIDFIVKIDEKLPEKLYGDGLKVKQIISNLLTNAVKYTNDGQILFEVLRKEYDHKEIIMEVRVTDTGIGIKEEDIPKLFESFKRLDEKRNNHIEGTGLGMCITQKYLELMKSGIEINSTYGKGSKFSFLLKQSIASKETLGDFDRRYKSLIESKRSSHGEKFSAPDASIMMIDDNSTNRVVFESLLKNTGMSITTLESGRECLEEVKKKHYDVIFLDHMMPDMDGIETLRELKKMENNQCADTPVIALTANTVTGAKNLYTDAGFDDYLAKPVLPNDLERVLLMYLPGDKIKEPFYDPKHTKKKYTSIGGLLDRIEGFDSEQAMKNCASEEILLQAIVVFCKSVEHYVECIADYLLHVKEAEARKLYTIEVHSIKSSIRLIGGVELSALAERLEAAGISGDIEYINEMTPLLLEQLVTLKLQLQMCIPRQSVVKKQMDDEKLNHLLRELICEMEILNIDRADELVEELAVNEWSKESEKLFHQLQSAVVNLNYEDTRQIAEKLLVRQTAMEEV